MDKPFKVEFHPQWDKKQATEGCAKTSSWGAHETIFPFSATLSMKPSGYSATDIPSVKSERTTHKNGRPTSSRPSASSLNWCWLKIAMLPKAT